MPKQIATPENRPRSFRLTTDADRKIDQAAEAQAATATDIVNAVCEQALPLWIKGVSDDMREIMFAASINAAAALRAIEKKLNKQKHTLGPRARAILIRDFLVNGVRNGVNRLLAPELSDQTALSHWCFAQADIDDLKLEGPVWDFVRSIGPTSPPPTKRQIEEIADEIGKLKTKARTKERAGRLEVLNVLLGIARDEHEREWAEVRRAEEEVRGLLTEWKA
ncbi:MAG TPA: hypothetical protein PLN53_01265 [Terricaulis sp.]|nr:hypothetical protein [Terricaulis sp.]